MSKEISSKTASANCPCIDPDAGKVGKRGWVFGDECEIHTPKKIIGGLYAIAPLSDLQASHTVHPSPGDIYTATFKHNPKYPDDCNERKYHNDRREQQKVMNYAKDFEPSFIINENVTPMDGAIIIDMDGIVLGGNGRTMILNCAKILHPDKYAENRKMLMRKSWIYGIAPDKIKDMADPVLVRVVWTNNYKEHNCNWYSRVFNEGMAVELDSMSKAISFAATLDPEKRKEVARGVYALIKRKGNTLSYNEGSFDNLTNNGRIIKYLFEIFIAEKLITSQSFDTYISKDDPNGTTLTEIGFVLIKHFLLALVFRERGLINYVSISSNIKILNVFGFLLQDISLSSSYKEYCILDSLVAGLRYSMAQNKGSRHYDSSLQMYTQLVVLAKNTFSFMQMALLFWLEVDNAQDAGRIIVRYYSYFDGDKFGMFGTKKLSPGEMMRQAIWDIATEKRKEKKYVSGRDTEADKKWWGVLTTNLLSVDESKTNIARENSSVGLFDQKKSQINKNKRHFYHLQKLPGRVEITLNDSGSLLDRWKADLRRDWQRFKSYF